MTTFSFDAPFVKLHRNHSWSEYFDSYSRDSDGHACFATYSFNAADIAVFARLMPFSVFYIAKQYRKEAAAFVRRFPMYLVFEVEKLHTKCVFFESSGRILVGSQNLYSASSQFEELSCEMFVPVEHREDAIKFCFAHKSERRITALYDDRDIQIYVAPLPECKSVIGKAFLPTHLERSYWSQFGDTDIAPGSDWQYIYCVLEYPSQGGTAYLAFDRHYRFCGELTHNAINKLREKFGFRTQDDVFLPAGNNLSRSSPFKDNFTRFHPIAKDTQATKAHYVDYRD